MGVHYTLSVLRLKANTTSRSWPVYAIAVLSRFVLRQVGLQQFGSGTLVATLHG